MEVLPETVRKGSGPSGRRSLRSSRESKTHDGRRSAAVFLLQNSSPATSAQTLAPSGNRCMFGRCAQSGATILARPSEKLPFFSFLFSRAFLPPPNSQRAATYPPPRMASCGTSCDFQSLCCGVARYLYAQILLFEGNYKFCGTHRTGVHRTPSTKKQRTARAPPTGSVAGVKARLCHLCKHKKGLKCEDGCIAHGSVKWNCRVCSPKRFCDCTSKKTERPND